MVKERLKELLLSNMTKMVSGLLSDVFKIIREVVENVQESVSTLLLGDLSNTYNAFDKNKTPYREDYTRYMARKKPFRSEFDVSSKEEAYDILGCIKNIIDTDGSISVSEVYEIVGEDAPYTGLRYGWKSMPRYSIRYTTDGMCMRLEEPVLLMR